MNEPNTTTTPDTVTTPGEIPEPKQRVSIFAPGFYVSMDLNKETIKWLVEFALKNRSRQVNERTAADR